MEHQRAAAGVDGDAAGSALGRAGVVLLTATCAAAAYRAAAAGDVASVAFVGVSYGALFLLLRFLRAYEVAPPEVWTLCTPLTAMFAWKVAGVMPQWPVAVGVWAAASAGGFALLFRQQQRRLGLRQSEEGGSGRDAKIGLGVQYADLVKMGLGVAACDSALAIASHHAHAHRGDADAGAGSLSLALVFVAYASFVALAWIFLRRFAARARARGAGQ